MDLYKTLQDYRKNKKEYATKQNKFYYKNNHLIEKYDYFSSFLGKDDSFSVIRSNIIIKSMMNKIEIEDSVQYAYKKSIEIYGEVNANFINNFVQERLLDLPYVQLGEEKIYIPFFSRALNKIYREECTKLLELPYSALMKNFSDSIVDPFETYNFPLYESMFTKLVKIKEQDKVSALYDIDYQTIFFVNIQGRLDAKICLFDMFIRRVNKNHIIDRITPVVDAYFASDKQKLLDALLNNNLASNYIIRKIRRREERHIRKVYR